MICSYARTVCTPVRTQCNFCERLRLREARFSEAVLTLPRVSPVTLLPATISPIHTRKELPACTVALTILLAPSLAVGARTTQTKRVPRLAFEGSFDDTLLQRCLRIATLAAAQLGPGTPSQSTLTADTQETEQRKARVALPLVATSRREPDLDSQCKCRLQ
jgi:hypothetical protein